MVKKKGSVKKKSAKKIAINSTPKGSAKLENVFHEVSREFFMVQIRDLEEKITRYQEKCDTLDLRNKEMEEFIERQAQDKKDIVSFLEKQLEEKSAELALAQENIQLLEKQSIIDREKHEKDLLDLKENMQDFKDQLLSENMILNGKLTALDDFRAQKDNILKDIAKKDEMLSFQEQKYNEELYQIERKAVIDKDRLKKEMILRVNTVASEFREVSNKQIADTTKRTIHENVVINSQLIKMSDQAVELVSENDDMKLKLKKLKEQLNIFESTEKELVKKNVSNLKVIRMLTEKIKEQEVLLQQFEITDKEHNLLKTQFKELNEQLDAQKNQFILLDKNNKNLLGKHEALLSDNKILAEDKDYLVGVVSDACKIIKQALQCDTTDEQLRSNVLFKLVEILNLATKMGIGFHLTDLSNSRKSVNRKQLLTSRPMRRSTSEEISLSSIQPIPHYKPGDLGFIPPLDKSVNIDKPVLNGSKSEQFYFEKKILNETQTLNKLVNGAFKLPLSLIHI